ncbi:MAG: DUF1501 domain-containing protein, partial [Bryobacteraceae bacterium]|nr:DUF1501 domain-containing protein [Bryobacteraceae bacterium]
MTGDENNNLKNLTRRHFFQQSSLFGIGSVALSAILNERLFAGTTGIKVRPDGGLHFAPKAKNVIFLFMAGAPSQLDLFDYKPALQKFDGQPCPEELIKGERFAFIKGVPKLLGSPHSFKRYGECGAELSNLLPHLAKIVDEVAIVKSLHTTQFNHAPGQI